MKFGMEICVTHRRLTLAGISAACALLAGCAEDGPPRYDVSGMVSFNGEPVPRGTIVFEPDTKKGNKGPQGFADIKDGHFNTADGGKGTVGGPHIARIAGFDGKPQNEQQYLGNPIFNEHLEEVDLPVGEPAAQDFVVPGTAGRNVPKGSPNEV